jgi:hypothetical protein
MSRPVPSKAELLERAILKVANDEKYVASDFRIWTGGSLNLDAVSEFLHCNRATAVKIGLCLRPSSSSFRADTVKIAALGGVNEHLLMGLLREAASLSAFRASRESPLMAAARDARVEESESPEEEDE